MNKSLFLSKTFWVNLIMAVIVLFPSAQAFVAAQPEIFTWVFVAVNLVLRIVTKSGVQII